MAKSNTDRDPAEVRAKKIKILTEQERHEGWIENLRNEERTMKE